MKSYLLITANESGEGLGVMPLAYALNEFEKQIQEAINDGFELQYRSTSATEPFARLVHSEKGYLTFAIEEFQEAADPETGEHLAATLVYPFGDPELFKVVEDPQGIRIENVFYARAIAEFFSAIADLMDQGWVLENISRTPTLEKWARLSNGTNTRWIYIYRQEAPYL